MEGTTFEELYRMYSLKDKTDYTGYTEEEVKEIYKGYLLSAIAKFPTCYEDREEVEVNELLELITPSLTLVEKDITVELMGLVSIEKDVVSIQSLSAILTTSDYKVVSGSQSLSEKESMVMNKQNYIDKLIAEYGTRINIKDIARIKKNKKRRY